MPSNGRLPATPGEIIDRSRKVTFTYEDEIIEARAGDTLASALYANGHRIFTRSLEYHRPRGLLCLSGRCPNCLMNVDGQPNVRTCTTPVVEGMTVKHQNAWPSLDRDLGSLIGKFASKLPVGFYYKGFIRPRWLWPLVQKFIRRVAGLGVVNKSLRSEGEYEHLNKHADIAILGGGPAGISAALEAAKLGFRVVLVDDQPTLGGSLRYRATVLSGLDERSSGLRGFELASKLAGEVASKPNIEVLTESTCFGFYEGSFLGIARGKTMIRLRTEKTIISTGSFERPFIFGNNDLPGIFLGRGLSRLVNLYSVKPGNKVLVATNNSYGYEVANDMLKAGLEVVALVDARSEPERDRPEFESIRRGEVPILDSHLLTEAIGSKRVNGAIVGQVDASGRIDPKSRKTFECDVIALSIGYEPDNSLLYQGGCRIEFDEELAERVPSKMATDVYTCGEVTGIHDLRINLLQGEVAGMKAALDFRNSGVKSRSSATRNSMNFGKKEVSKRKILKQLVKQYRGTTRTRLVTTSPSQDGKRIACICEDVTEEDLHTAIEEGFDDVETLKRYSTFSMGPCQGKMCSLVSASVCAGVKGLSMDNIGVTTSRPPSQPVRLGLLAGPPHIPEKLTPTHYKHLELNAEWMEVGEWKRPHHYSTVEEEYKSVREKVGIIDVSTLGRFDVKGRDAGKFLDFVFGHIYSNMKVGKVRYAPVYAETGIILDDGVIARLGEDHYWITSSTGNADFAEQWLRWWEVQTKMCVHLTNITSGLAGINVAGPRARELLSTLVSTDLSPEAFPYMTYRAAEVSGVPAMLLRIGFVGEASWEVHYPAEYGEYLWDTLLERGKSYGIAAVGVETMRVLSLEKRHFWPTLDTDTTSDALEAGLEWAVKFEKADFIGRHYLLQTKKKGLKQKIIGFTIKGPTIVSNGDVITHEGKPVGRVTTARYSYHLKKCVGMGWVPIELAGEGQSIRIIHEKKVFEGELVSGAFYDAEGGRMRS